MLKIYIIVLISSFFTLMANAATIRPFIIDSDMGVDDVIAMTYMLKRPDIDVKAITIAGNGITHCKPALKNAFGLLQLLQKSSIPIACGLEVPLSGHHQYTKQIRQESDSLAGVAILLPQKQVHQKVLAVNLLLKTLQGSARPVDILEIGPLTNIAELLLKHPEIKHKIRMIYIMGGAVNVKGNITEVYPESKNHTAEWNIYVDPKASDIVFRSGIPLTLVPLDVTNRVLVDYHFYEEVKKHQVTPINKFIYQMVEHNFAEIDAHRWYFWDPLTAAIATDESMATFKNMKLRVLTSPEERSGTTVIDNQEGQVVRVCTRVDIKYFKQVLLQTINN